MEYFISMHWVEPGSMRFAGYKCTNSFEDAMDYISKKCYWDIGIWHCYIFHCKYENNEEIIIGKFDLKDYIKGIEDENGNLKTLEDTHKECDLSDDEDRKQEIFGYKVIYNVPYIKLNNLLPDNVKIYSPVDNKIIEFFNGKEYITDS